MTPHNNNISDTKLFSRTEHLLKEPRCRCFTLIVRPSDCSSSWSHSCLFVRPSGQLLRSFPCSSSSPPSLSSCFSYALCLGLTSELRVSLVRSLSFAFIPLVNIEKRPSREKHVIQLALSCTWRQQHSPSFSPFLLLLLFCLLASGFRSPKSRNWSLREPRVRKTKKKKKITWQKRK